MNTRIQDLFKQIADAQQEIAEIREDCPHMHYELGLWSWRIGCVNIRRICTECGDVLTGQITEEERNEFNKTNGTSYL
jgi:hypothetical protein